MKDNLYLTFLAFLLLTSCEKEPDDQYLGKQDYFFCKINGMPLKINGNAGCPKYHANYRSNDTAQIHLGHFAINGGNCEPLERVGVDIVELKPTQKVYRWSSDSVRFFYLPDDFNQFDSAISGEIKFTTIIPPKYNGKGQRTEPAKVEGTFHFTVIDSAGKEIKITDGRFGFFRVPAM